MEDASVLDVAEVEYCTLPCKKFWPCKKFLRPGRRFDKPSARDQLFNAFASLERTTIARIGANKVSSACALVNQSQSFQTTEADLEEEQISCSSDDVVRHALRHTAATLLMQSGTNRWQAAGLPGMTVEPLESGLQPSIAGGDVSAR